MEIMTQERYRAYRADLAKQGYMMMETTPVFAEQENEYGSAIKISCPEMLTKKSGSQKFWFW